MQIKLRRSLLASLILFLLFLALTTALLTADIRPIGPNGSFVGLAALNSTVAQAVGVHLFWYVLTDWLGMAACTFFEVFVVNYRPTLLNGMLEASYPSSHTILVLCILGTALLQARLRLKGRLQTVAQVLCVLAMAMTVMSRFLSGVHWFTDLLGGVLLGFSLVALYLAALRALRLPV